MKQSQIPDIIAMPCISWVVLTLIMSPIVKTTIVCHIKTFLDYIICLFLLIPLVLPNDLMLRIKNNKPPKSCWYQQVFLCLVTLSSQFVADFEIHFSRPKFVGGILSISMQESFEVWPSFLNSVSMSFKKASMIRFMA